MAREVQAEDFSDSEIEEIFNSVEKLVWSSHAKLPKWVEEQAEVFAELLPRPTPAELRDHIEHAVRVARGWNDPEDRRVMLHAAIKSYYLLAWIDHLERRGGRHKVEPAFGYQVSFTPQFNSPE